jgi:DUF4097 and DUF4098 domain-containing protein YvlB
MTRIVLATCVAATLTACQLNIFDSDRALDVEVTESFSAQLDATGDEALVLEGINGFVTVVGYGGSTVDVQAERRVRSDTRADAQEFLGRVTVEVSEVGGEIRVRTDQPNRTDGREVTVDYDLVVPSSLDVTVVNVNGEVEVRSVGASVTVENVNGRVRVLNVTGDVDVRLVNGDVLCDVTLLPGGRADASVVNGNITLDVPVAVSAVLDADVVNGTVTVSGLTVTNATVTTRSVHGRLGAGDGSIELDATNGTITVRGK